MKKIVLILLSMMTFYSCSKDKKVENESTKECKCFKGIGSSEKDAPILTYKFSNGESVSVCGFADKETEGIISEFNIFNCESGKSYTEFGALKICKIAEGKDELKIEELKYLPVGKDWNWELVQIGEQKLTLQNNEVVCSKLEPKLGEIQISEELQNEYLNSLKENKDLSKDWELNIGKLEALSLIGNQKAWEILKSYEDFTGEKVSGEAAEQLHEAIKNVEWLKGNN